MNWLFRRARQPLVQSSPEEWKRRWQSLVPPENLPNAVGLNSAAFNGARLVGPGIAGRSGALAGL